MHAIRLKIGDKYYDLLVETNLGRTEFTLYEKHSLDWWDDKTTKIGTLGADEAGQLIARHILNSPAYTV